MTSVALRPAARADLVAIGRYTERVWGREQRTRYLRYLGEHIHRLRRDPELGRPREDIRPGYRSLSVGRHVIFYRLGAAGVDIVRVLHSSMDVGRHL